MTNTEARAEAIRRAATIARGDYKAFLTMMFPAWPHAQHHDLIINNLQMIRPGSSQRIMWMLPPGSAKSTYANVRYIPFYMGKYPGTCTILATHTGTFAKKWGRRSRAIASAPGYQQIFDCTIDRGVKASDGWMLSNGSEYMSVGAEGTVTGNRGDLIVIDDPVKGREEADSQTIRDKLWDWYNEDLWTRLKPNGSIFLIMTRWHEDDLAGRLLEAEKNGGEKWTQIRVCAEAEANDPLGRNIGEPLWPEWFTPQMFAQAKTQPRMWASLYQQRPAPDEGAYFKREWFKFYEQLPGHLKFYGASDYAVTADGGDYTVHIVAGVDKDDNIYIVDLWRGQTDSLEWVEALLGMFRQHKPQIWAEEAGVILKSMGPIINKRLMEERLYGTYRKQFTSATDKPTRARSLQARMQMGKVFFPKSAPWLADLTAEMLTFPAGKHDDQVDAMALLSRMLVEMQAAHEPKVEKPLAQRLAEMKPPTVNDIFARHLKKCRRD